MKKQRKIIELELQNYKIRYRIRKTGYEMKKIEKNYKIRIIE